MKGRQRPRKSLRTILILWLLVFSIVPLAFLTGYSLVKFEQAIDQEMSTRLVGNARQISQIFSEFQSALMVEAHQIAADRALIYYLSANSAGRARESLSVALKASHASRKLWVYNRDGDLEVALYKDENNQIQHAANMESVVTLTEATVKQINGKDDVLMMDFERKTSRDSEGKPATSMVMEFSVFTKVIGPANKVVGYVEQANVLGQGFLDSLRNRLNAEVFFFRADKPTIMASHEDLSLYKIDTFLPHLKDDGFFELSIRSNPFRLMLRDLKWGDSDLIMGLGASKSAAKAIQKNVNIAFFTVVGAIMLLLIILSVLASRALLTPIYEVLGGLERADFDRELLQIPTTNQTELGLLAEGFNALSRRTFESQRALKDKIQELEKANNEIRDTQAKLVHSAKMASLGQLVAGVAHELNNPISFIYSNMTHLREYSEKLIQLIEVAEKHPERLEKEKERAELNYIEKDLPKLISSCEDGARRTRDIVLGLRNFSRLDESQLKFVDVHEGLETTLELLRGELKNRVHVVKKFGKLPKVNCYASQLNQVFMNVLSNAAQAIENEGEIHITTKTLPDDQVEISIRDNGKGMAKATLDKIFDPFFTTKGVGTGTGLGLSISYGVIQKHGGDILVKSEIGKGTEFRIILPVRGPVDRAS